MPEFVLAGVSKGFPRTHKWVAVLDDVSLELEPGEVGAIIGGRLGGKTTLLRIAAGMQRPDEGIVSLGEQNLTGLSERSLANLRGREIIWLAGNCPDDGAKVAWFVGGPLSEGSRKRADRIAAQALERVGAQDCSGMRAGDLSHWQRALVAFARAFAAQPQLIVIDDLLDVLGPRHTQAASDLLRSLISESNPRCMALMSVTDKESALFADRTWRLTRKGTLSEWTGQRQEGAVLPFPDRGDARGTRTAGNP